MTFLDPADNLALCAHRYSDWPLRCRLPFEHEGQHEGIMRDADMSWVNDPVGTIYRWPKALLTRVYPDGTTDAPEENFSL